MIDSRAIDALGRRPSQGPGQGGGSVWTTDPWQDAHAEWWCREAARDDDELAEFLDALGLA